MGVGSLNPCPMHVGGGPSNTERVYRAMRRMVGQGGSAENDRGIDGLWRRSRAHGIAAGQSALTRAALQAYPHLATDALPYYERVLGLTRWTDETEAGFRRRVWDAWVRALAADCPHMAADLAAIDSRITILEPAYSTTTEHGRAFGPLDSSLESPAFGGTGHAIAPNYSTDFVLYVLFDVGHGGAPTISEQRTIEAVRAYLIDVLPSWLWFVICTDTGFVLDVSSLDITGFGA